MLYSYILIIHNNFITCIKCVLIMFTVTLFYNLKFFILFALMWDLLEQLQAGVSCRVGAGD